jgi:Predicted phosphoesterases, related to the Icc protein
MKIVCFGDIHMATSQIHRMAGKLADARLAVVSGDITSFGGTKEALEVLSAVREHCSDVLAVSGNLDRPEVIELLDEEGISLHGKARSVDGVGLFGCGGSNRTPFDTPTEFAEEELLELLEQGWRERRGNGPLVMVCHTPPYGTRVDRLRLGRHVGSKVVREFIERHQPDICITGHVHEAAGVDKIGKTQILNPGPLAKGGYVLIERAAEGKLEAAINYI